MVPENFRLFRRSLPALAFLALLGLCGCAESPPRGSSVLLITLDTTRADRLGCYGHAGADTPVLDRLAARGALFESAYTAAPITLPAHASIFTGTYPQFHGVRDNGSFLLDPRLVTLAEVFADAGFRTGAFVGAYPVDSKFGLNQGFEVYDDQLPPASAATGFSYPERPAAEVVASAADWLAGLDGDARFLAWVHVFDPHAPYAAPEPFASRHAADPYQGEVAYVDHALGELLAGLEGLGRGDDTLIVVVADHGEGLGEHGEETHTALIYDSTMRVPLLLAGPGIPAGLRVGETVRTIDILPTLTELLRLDTPADHQGASLLPLLSGAAGPPRAAYLESEWPRLQYGWSALRGLVFEGWKIIVAPDAVDSAAELYRIAEDPRETTDRLDEVAALDRTRRELARVLAATTADEPFDAARSLSAEDEERLRALGYIGTPQAEPRPGADPRERMRVMRGTVAVRNMIREGRLHEALALLDRLEAEDPGGLGLHEHRGLVYRELGARDPSVLPVAAAEFQRALQINPRRADLWVHLGEVQRLRGDYAGALESYARSMALAPPSPELQINLAGVLAVMGRNDEAFEQIQALLREHPDHAAGRLTQAVMLAGLDRRDEALAEFERVIALSAGDDPQRARAHELTGLLLEQMERHEEALRHYEAALALDPERPEAQAGRSRVRTGPGRS